ncbi:unnamed protein product [Dracunculus medinensis]|uniref:ULP_PROTEASE domain-containing protein n=1 Tax=Dracunculus medinensis TaxID=318479 RepID=A0A0N4UKG6_DRAME|nr:unnamed protein product [Dracunculus medinensis]
MFYSLHFQTRDLEKELVRIRFSSLSIRIKLSDFLCLEDGALINDTIIDFYLNHIIEHLAESCHNVYVFPSLFWHYLISTDDCMKVLLMMTKFTNSETWSNSLSKADFIVIPINDSDHWSLAIICYPSYSRRDINNRSVSPVVLFDSQQSVGIPIVNNILPMITKFFNFVNVFNGACEVGLCSFNGFIPQNLPQQENDVDCGIYILEYAKRFFLSPPNKACLLKSAFDFSVLYPDFCIYNKRNEIKRVISTLCIQSIKWKNLMKA